MVRAPTPDLSLARPSPAAVQQGPLAPCLLQQEHLADRDIPVVFLSGREDPQEQTRGCAAGGAANGKCATGAKRRELDVSASWQGLADAQHLPRTNWRLTGEEGAAEHVDPRRATQQSRMKILGITRATS